MFYKLMKTIKVLGLCDNLRGAAYLSRLGMKYPGRDKYVRGGLTKAIKSYWYEYLLTDMSTKHGAGYRRDNDDRGRYDNNGRHHRYRDD